MDESEELARARLAFLSAGRPPIGGPRRADLQPPEPEVVSTAGSHEPDPPLDRAKATAGRVIRSLTMKHVMVVVALLALAVVATVVALGKSAATEVPISPATVSRSAAAPPSPSKSSSPERVRVHVAGSVATPGVVVIVRGSIVQDAIAAAGGLSPDADPADLNLAAPVSDGMQIRIGSSADPEGMIAVAGPGVEASGEVGGGKLDLNSATAAQLEELPGIGPVTAGAIIAWREEHGPFSSVEQLQEIDGIGPKTFDRLEPKVTT